MPEKDLGQERHERFKEVFESLLVSRQLEKTEQREFGPEAVEKRIAAFPDSIKAKLRGRYRRLQELAGPDADPVKLAEAFEDDVVGEEQKSLDRRFTVGEGEYMPNKPYAREQMIGDLRELLGDSPTPEDLKKIALLNFDANGLKAVNDLSGSHESGTAYLKRIAEVLHAKDSPIAKRLKELGITDILAVTAGGDEYSVRLKSDKPIPPQVIAEALELCEQAIQSIDVSDLVDFSAEPTQLRYLGISEREWAAKSPEDRARILEDVRKEFPEGFKMRASASGGGATLYDGMLAALEHPSKPLTREDGFGRAVDKIVGGLWDAADKQALENKTAYKESLRAPDASAADKFYSKVLARTSEARVLEAKIDALALEAQKTKAFEREMDELDQLLESGAIDEATYGRNLRALRKKHREGAQA
jgi:GGDEF domain-containing protein